MKGIPGLLLALGLGLVGAFASWFYLAQKSRELDQIEFVAIAPDKEINTGHLFAKGDLVPVPIPSKNIGNLERVAIKWEKVNTVYDFRARKTYASNEFVFHQDLATPPDTDILSKLGDNEQLISVPVDSRTTVPSLLNPDNIVSFIVPKARRGLPTPVDRSPGTGTSVTEIIGPFRILSLGNRLGTTQSMKAQNLAPMQENVVSVAVKMVNGQFDEKSQKLVDALALSNFQQVQVMLHKSADGKKK